MAPPWVIIGCGYVGVRLARALVGQGEQVTVTRRDWPEDVEPPLGTTVVRADLANPDTLGGIFPPDAIVVVLAPPGPAPAAEIRGLLEAASVARRFVYASSTGVYGAAGGAWVDEKTPVAPLSAAGAARLAAETAFEGTLFSHVALRIAGIYGPGRGIAERLRAGMYRVVGDGTSHVSRIHVDDLVQAVIRAGGSALTGAINIADDDPAPIGEVADAIAAQLGMPPPPRVPADAVPAEVAAMLTADRRIANRRMKGPLGVVLRYPSWRDAPVA